MADKVTQELIEDGMARAEKVACRPGDHWCYPFANRLEDAQSGCMPKDRRRIGGTRRVILGNGGRDTRGGWLGALLAPDPNGQIITVDQEEVAV